jgi:hypothetical protein
MPDVQPEHEVGVEETVGSTDPAPSASSAAADSTSLAEKHCHQSLLPKQLIPKGRLGHRTRDANLGGG